MSDIAVRVDDVSKKFRMYQERNQTLKSAIMRGRTSVHEDFWALKDVTFDVPTGSTFGLIGSNGSGKSTLLKCLAKIYYPEKGSITALRKSGGDARGGQRLPPGAFWAARTCS